jgi:hypothetical protein
MGDRYVKVLLAGAAMALAAGCGGGPAPAARPDGTAAAPARLSAVQACRELLGDLGRNRGVPDIPTLRRIADHVTAPRMAADARTAVRDMDHTGTAPIALSLLRDECARAGVRIPDR